MNTSAKVRYESALLRIDGAIAMLSGEASRVYRDELYRARGDLVAMRQLLDLESTLTEPHQPYRLRSITKCCK